MTTTMIRPTPFALAISRAYGTCRLEPQTPIRWVPCPTCGRRAGPQMTICRTCDGGRRIAVMEVRR